MNIKLLSDHVLIKLIPPIDRKIGNIIIPDNVDLGQRFNFGYVYGVGEGKKKYRSLDRISMDTINVGDKVMIPKYAGVQLIIDYDDYVILKIKEIYCVVED